MRLLLVEDDQMLGCAIRDGLTVQFAVDLVACVQDANLALMTTSYDLVILDISLPDGSGFDVLKEARLNKIETPILILTARDAVRHRIEGLNSGADDYLVKPFDLDELIARCNALLRRSNKLSSTNQVWGNVSFDSIARIVRIDDQPIRLSSRELSILTVLMANRGRVVAKSKIEEAIYDWDNDVESNTVEVHISSLRRKLRRDMIQTLRGIGYMIPDAP